MNKYENKEKYCPICEGLVYKKGLVGNRVYQCVRCERWFSLIELNEFWINKYKEVRNDEEV